MKTVILAGGRGTSLAEYTGEIPKPMVTIGDLPIVQHIMSIYACHGFKDFVLALGFKGQLIREYFLNLHRLSSDATVDLRTGALTPHGRSTLDWRVSLIDTGLDTMTGGRLKRLENFIGSEPFFLTYGDGLANINISDLLSFHRSHGKMVTVSAVHPIARFGEISFNQSGKVSAFKEKPQTTAGWVNGGFFVCQPEFLTFIKDDSTILEREPLEEVAALGQLMAYKHEGFWHCMDTVRDRLTLESLWQSGEAPWITAPFTTEAALLHAVNR